MTLRKLLFNRAGILSAATYWVVLWFGWLDGRPFPPWSYWVILPLCVGAGLLLNYLAEQLLDPQSWHDQK